MKIHSYNLASFFLLTVMLILVPSQSKAFMEENTIPDTMIYSSSFTLEYDITDYIPDFVTVPKGGLSWDVFALTDSVEYEFKGDDGQEMYGFKPEFADDLKKLDGQTVLMQGYMFPLNAEEQQTKFLFGPFPVSCPFHYHVGPNLIIEAQAKDKIKYEWEAVNIRGRLELVPRDDEFNVFYRLHDVELAK